MSNRYPESIEGRLRFWAERDRGKMKLGTTDWPVLADEAAQRIETLERLAGTALGHLECTTTDHRKDAIRVLREAFGLSSPGGAWETGHAED